MGDDEDRKQVMLCLQSGHSIKECLQEVKGNGKGKNATKLMERNSEIENGMNPEDDEDRKQVMLCLQSGHSIKERLQEVKGNGKGKNATKLMERNSEIENGMNP